MVVGRIGITQKQAEVYQLAQPVKHHFELKAAK